MVRHGNSRVVRRAGFRRDAVCRRSRRRSVHKRRGGRRSGRGVSSRLCVGLPVRGGVVLFQRLFLRGGQIRTVVFAQYRFNSDRPRPGSLSDVERFSRNIVSDGIDVARGVFVVLRDLPDCFSKIDGKESK